MSNFIFVILYKAILIVVLLFGSLNVGSAYAGDAFNIRFPETAPPSGSSWVWIGRQMMVDGTPMSMKSFSYSGSEPDFISHFESLWKTQGHGVYTRKILGPKHFLSYVTQQYATTVEYTAEMGALNGTIAVSSKKQFKAKIDSAITKPPGARIISNIESLDEGIYSQSITMLSRKNERSNLDYCNSQLIAMGWQKVYSRCDISGCAGQYQSSQGQLQISIKDLPGSGSKGSRILVHLIKQ